MGNPNHRLHIFTGKGGVGKTTLSLAFAKYLINNKKKVLYNAFDQEEPSDLCKVLDIPCFNFSLKKSAEIYIAHKLNSKVLAAGIVRTPFFISLLQVLPGLGHLIMLGHIFYELKNDPELHIVMDSPPSGHALTMFESPRTFKDIFRSGLLVNDIESMLDFILDDATLKTTVVSLPTEMALQESLELVNTLHNYPLKNVSLIINNHIESCYEMIDTDKSELPPFLEKTIDMQRKVIKSSPVEIEATIPYISFNDTSRIINTLTPAMEQLA